MPRRNRTGKPPRQSVTVPSPMAAEVRHVENLKATYRRFMKERDRACKQEAGTDLIRSIFGKNAIAEDPLP